MKVIHYHFPMILSYLHIYGSSRGVEKKINSHLKTLNECFNKWSLTLSIKKTNYIIFAQNKSMVDDLRLRINDLSLSYCTNPSFLVIKFIETLNMNENQNLIKKKAIKRLNITKIAQVLENQ